MITTSHGMRSVLIPDSGSEEGFVESINPEPLGQHSHEFRLLPFCVPTLVLEHSSLLSSARFVACEERTNNHKQSKTIARHLYRDLRELSNQDFVNMRGQIRKE